MAAISSAQHKDFCDYARKQISLAQQVAPGKYLHHTDNFIAEHVQLLETFFDEYQHKVKELYDLIERYEAIKKKTRIQIRKRSVGKKNNDTSSTQNLSIKKAS